MSRYPPPPSYGAYDQPPPPGFGYSAQPGYPSQPVIQPPGGYYPGQPPTQTMFHNASMEEQKLCIENIQRKIIILDELFLKARASLHFSLIHYGGLKAAQHILEICEINNQRKSLVFFLYKLEDLYFRTVRKQEAIQTLKILTQLEAHFPEFRKNGVIKELRRMLPQMCTFPEGLLQMPYFFTISSADIKAVISREMSMFSTQIQRHMARLVEDLIVDHQ